MTDIRAFIEARLAEREALLCDLAAQMANGGENMRGGWNLWGDFGTAVNRLVNLQELADDIGAKRKLIDRYADQHYHAPALPDSTFPEFREEETGACRTCITLRLLAHPFRQHPDFNPAWRIKL